MTRLFALIFTLAALLVPTAAFAQTGCTVTVGDGKIIVSASCVVELARRVTALEGRG